MDHEQIPERSSLWLGSAKDNGISGKLFDRVTIVFSLFLAVITFSLFWPIIINLEFKEVFFTPLVPFLIYIFGIFNIDPISALRLIYAFSFVFVTVGIYLLVRDMTKRQLTAILSSVIFLIPPIPVFILTFFTQGLNHDQLQSTASYLTVFYGSPARFLALSLIPVTVLFFQRYLKETKTRNFSAIVSLCALVLLADRTQSFNLLVILTIVFLNSLLLGMARVKLRRLFFVIVFSVGLVSFWYTPTFWFNTLIIFFSYIRSHIEFLFPLPFTLLVTGFLFSFVFFGKREERKLIFIAFLLFFIFLGLTVDSVFSLKSFVPYPHRLIPNLNMFGSIVLAINLSILMDRFAIVSKVKAEFWSINEKVMAAILFGIESFLLFAVFAFIIFPFAREFASGDGGMWERIIKQLISENTDALALSGGGYFKLVADAGSGHSMPGIIFTAIFGIWLLILVFMAPVLSGSNSDEDMDTE